jgi:hypothetical protein
LRGWGTRPAASCHSARRSCSSSAWCEGLVTKQVARSLAARPSARREGQSRARTGSNDERPIDPAAAAGQAHPRAHRVRGERRSTPGLGHDPVPVLDEISQQVERLRLEVLHLPARADLTAGEVERHPTRTGFPTPDRGAPPAVARLPAQDQKSILPAGVSQARPVVSRTPREDETGGRTHLWRCWGQAPCAEASSQLSEAGHGVNNV